MKALLVDPSLLIEPYDTALTGGLRAAGVDARWATRPLRPDDEGGIPADAMIPQFYRMTDGHNRARYPAQAAKLMKGIEHAVGLHRLNHLARRLDADIVHFQFLMLPWLDARAITRLKRERPVVLTVHDTTPYNGANVSKLQVGGLERAFSVPDHLIVHTQNARVALEDMGIAPDRISVIPHGPLPFRSEPQPAADKSGRWRIVLFGRLQSYKGLDVLIEALGMMSAADRDRIEVIVAGVPHMALEPILARAAELGLEPPMLQFRLHRLSDQEMTDLLHSADTLVFPYRAIEASGVLYLTAYLGKWMVASALGSFRELLENAPDRGALVPPGDPAALAQALKASIGRRIAPGTSDWLPTWEQIGTRTAALYTDLLKKRGKA